MIRRHWIAGAWVVLVGCGDSGGGTASASAGTTTLPMDGTSSGGVVPTTGGAEAEATATTGNGGSMSLATTEGTSTGEPTTGAVDPTASTSTSTSSSSSSGEPGTSSETGGPGVCEAPDPSPGSVPVDDACTIVEMVGSWTPVIEWTDVSLGVTYTTPAIANCTDDNGDGKIDGDDIPDIAVATAAGAVHLLSGDGAGKHWTAPQNMGAEPSSATIADLDGDGRPEVVVSGTTGFYAWHCDTGALYWQNAMGGSPTICGGSSVYDVDGDGQPEVVQGNRIFNGQTGALRGAGMFGHGTGYGGDLINFGVVADLDQDGTQEVLVGNAAYDADGNAKWQNGLSDGYVAVGDFDDDEFGEMVVATSPGNVRLQDDDGTVIWMVNVGGSTIGPPTIADFDGDGEPEIGVSGTNLYAVLDGNGTTLWKKVIADGSGFTGSSVFDFNGDLAA